jgi:glutamyl/glutaminyl-tRNA synthetase
MTDEKIKTRIAPTPSGFLHLGNAFSFVLTWLIAKSSHANLLLRIDDIDTARKKPEYIEDIFRTLDWLGLDYDQGPSGPDDFEKHYSQHRRLDYYLDLLNRLRENGYLFACTCSRKQVQEHSHDGQYPGTCYHLNIPWNQPHTAWRILTPPSALITWQDLLQGEISIELNQYMKDFVVRKKDQLPAYQLVSWADDQYYDINLIVRGEDLIPSTAAQLLIGNNLLSNNWKQPHLLHHPLLKDQYGEKLSKSRNANPLLQYRQQHKSPEIFYRWMSIQLKLEKLAGQLTELLDAFQERYSLIELPID